jgi:hypothetical protein
MQCKSAICRKSSDAKKQEEWPFVCVAGRFSADWVHWLGCAWGRSTLCGTSSVKYGIVRNANAGATNWKCKKGLGLLS